MRVLRIVLAAVFIGLLAVPAQPAQAACGAALPATKGLISLNLTVPSTATYRVWVRMLAPAAGTDGFYLQLPNAGLCGLTMANGGIPANAWTWVDYQNATSSAKVNAPLSAGSHGLRLAGLDDGVLVDKVLLAADQACVPTGDGANCSAAAATPAPTAKPVTVGQTSSPVPVPSGLTEAKCSVDGKAVACSDINTRKLSDGEHVVAVSGTGQDGQPVQKTTTVRVKNNRTVRTTAFGAIALLVFGTVVAWYVRRRLRLRNDHLLPDQLPRP